MIEHALASDPARLLERATDAPGGRPAEHTGDRPGEAIRLASAGEAARASAMRMYHRSSPMLALTHVDRRASFSIL